jgi:hypothetical protein
MEGVKSILNVVIWRFDDLASRRPRSLPIDHRNIATSPNRQIANSRNRQIIAIAVVVLAVLAGVACRSMLRPKYEYDEDVFLALDGSAVVYLNASVPALVALRGVELDVDPHARLDRGKVRALFESPVTHVVNTTTSRRDNRRYVHLRIEVSDIRRLAEAPPFAWSTYRLDRTDDLLTFRQTVGAAAGKTVGDVGWHGDELVAFRLHLPSRVPFHNSPTRKIERGNIIAWEQPLADRLKGQPVSIDVQMENESILIRTLTLFAITIVLVLATFALAIWWVRRAGSTTPPEAQPRVPPTAA